MNLHLSKKRTYYVHIGTSFQMPPINMTITNRYSNYGSSGEEGYYFTNSKYDDTHVYHLLISSSYIYYDSPTYYGGNSGFSLRCLAR